MPNVGDLRWNNGKRERFTKRGVWEPTGETGGGGSPVAATVAPGLDRTAEAAKFKAANAPKPSSSPTQTQAGAIEKRPEAKSLGDIAKEEAEKRRKKAVAAGTNP